MILSEMERKSPFRIFEKSIHGGLGKGNIGVFMARPGVGKTACLVYLALDEIVRGNKVLHFGVEKSVEKVSAWYNEMASNLAETFQLSNNNELREKIDNNLIIMSYVNGSFSAEKMESAIRTTLNQGGFSPHVIIVDGFDFENTASAEVAAFKEIAEEFNIEMWFSARTHREGQILNEHGIPAPYSQFEEELSVVVVLDPVQDAIFLRLLKDHDDLNPSALHVKLDPRTLLVKPRYT
jgi:predicted ATP-dependent serine protease